ncbi:hypothetical protein N8500_06575 [Candidatus Puniceispirillum sp.]|nr:hypothetical protein [Candidatus Puniceispirillum sp.]
MNIKDMVIKHCPHCDGPCLVSQNEIDAEHLANKKVAIACHHCSKQFSLDGDHTKDDGIAHPEKMQVNECPSCKELITIPNPLPDQTTMELRCPLCDSKFELGQAEHGQKIKGNELSPTIADKIIAHQTEPDNKLKTSYTPLYILIIICIAAFAFWAKETGQLPVNHWLKILE